MGVGFNPHRCGRAGRGGCSKADSGSREWLADCVPFYQNISFSSHPCLFPCQGLLPLLGLQSCRLRGAANLLTPKQSWRCPKMGGQPSHTPRSIYSLEEGLGQRALPLGNAPLAPFGAGHPKLCTGGELTTEILYLHLRGDSMALAVWTWSP